MIEIITTNIGSFLSLSSSLLVLVFLILHYRLIRRRKKEYEDIVAEQRYTLEKFKLQFKELDSLRAKVYFDLEKLDGEESIIRNIELSKQEEGLLSFGEVTSKFSSIYEYETFTRRVNLYRILFKALNFQITYDKIHNRSGEDVRRELQEIDVQQSVAFQNLERRIIELTNSLPDAEDNHISQIIQGDDREGEDELEPSVIIGVLGSISSIISLLQQNKEKITPGAVLAIFNARAQKEDTPEHKLGLVTNDADILANARTMIGIHDTNSMFLKRIVEKCLNPYTEAIKDHELDDTDLEEVRGETVNCVCSNIAMARKDNSGSFPSDEFKELWKKFGCA